ncbi:MAG: hypothetical protein U0228_21225 [Myxococcaceae bacterium]
MKALSLAVLVALPAVAQVEQATFTEVPLAGPCAGPDAELSGLAWLGDDLVLVTQYPHRFESSFCAISRAQLDALKLDGTDAPVTPRLLHVDVGPWLGQREGFEAMTTLGRNVFLTFEAEDGEGGKRSAFLLRGELGDGGLVFDPAFKVELPAQAQFNGRDLPNVSYEALTARDGQVFAFYEWNGSINPHPHALSWSPDAGLREVPLQPLEYRVTDATLPDEQGRFWVIDYLFTRDAKYVSDAGQERLEQLVELQFSKKKGGGIERTASKPIRWPLLDAGVDADEKALTRAQRNWEGVVRYRDGFLLATDRYPVTTVGYVRRATKR